MQISLNWLRRWVDVKASATEIASVLNLAGLEAEAAPLPLTGLDGVVVGRILSAERHPQADRLQVCVVDIGSGTPQQIVCGAANARAGLCAPVATVGCVLPGGVQIKAAQLRGVDSNGMLCSAKELNLSDKSEGLLELDRDARPGTPIVEYLALRDELLTLELTPNRGDCLSVNGLARELAALYGVPMVAPLLAAVPEATAHRLGVEIENFADCTAYAGRVIENIDVAACTPDWMRETLRRSGIRSIHPVVDITNYVMLELGQPMHAFDLAKLGEGIRVRRARAGETLKLLTGDEVQLASELLITSGDQPVALAGVMGGADSGVSAATTRIFLESAAFGPAAVVGVARRHKLSSDAAYRYERGVDPALHSRALARATELILSICGGAAGPVTTTAQPAAVPSVRLSLARTRDLMGVAISAAEVEAYLQRLGMTLEVQGGGTWRVTPPSWRFDLAIEQDLIEEVARLYGYARIPAKPYAAALVPPRSSEALRPAARLRDALAARGWQEIVTYSFVEPTMQAALAPDVPGLLLDNPIAETMGVMRTTLWTGLIGTWLYNHQRQTKRVRLFELASTFAENAAGIVETPRLSGLIFGSHEPEQWGVPARAADFYDLKGELELLAALFGGGHEPLRFEAAAHAALHPGRSARIWRGAQCLGLLGELHPQQVAALDLPSAPLLFELDWNAFAAAHVPVAAAVPEFPSSRRDLALVVPEATPAQQLVDAALGARAPQLKSAKVFDVYRGQGLGEASKSVALGLIFQDYSRTLTVEEIDMQVAEITAALAEKAGAVVRA
jgi:phenylalanyl-tRNA synthetase beta chain